MAPIVRRSSGASTDHSTVAAVFAHAVHSRQRVASADFSAVIHAASWLPSSSVAATAAATPPRASLPAGRSMLKPRPSSGCSPRDSTLGADGEHDAAGLRRIEGLHEFVELDAQVAGRASVHRRRPVPGGARPAPAVLPGTPPSGCRHSCAGACLRCKRGGIASPRCRAMKARQHRGYAATAPPSRRPLSRCRRRRPRSGARCWARSRQATAPPQRQLPCASSSVPASSSASHAGSETGFARPRSGRATPEDQGLRRVVDHFQDARHLPRAGLQVAQQRIDQRQGIGAGLSRDMVEAPATAPSSTSPSRAPRR